RRIALARRKAQDFEEVAVGIAEVERLDAARAGIPIGQTLGLGRGVGDTVCAQMRIRPIHVADDDDDVLEPAIVAPRIAERYAWLGTPARAFTAFVETRAPSRSSR